VAFGEGLPPVVRSLVRRNSWVGEVLLVLVAAAALVVVVGQAGGSAARASGSPDPLTVVTPLLVGLAASVLVLRGYPWLLRGAARMLRGRGHAPSFVGVLEATRTAAVAWLVAAALTATTAGVLTLELVVGADRAQRATNTPGAPLLVPGVIPLAACAVVLCAAFAAAAFAVSSVSETEPRRARARVLYVLGFRRAAASGVSLWGSAPAAVVSVVIGAIVGVACTAPVLAAVGAHAGASHGAIDWPLVVAVAAGILVCALVIAVVAVASDSRALAPAPAPHDGSEQQPRRKS
jgi:putative ABC transport system permease protein